MKTSFNKAISIIKKVLWGILCTIFGLLIIVLGWLSIDKFIIKSPVPSFFGYSSLIIQTGSMNGYSALVQGGKPKQVDIGDMIIIKNTNDYKIGDVITFLPPGDKIPTTHRIIGYTANGYLTKGDANNAQDTASIEHQYVLGEVVLHLPKVGVFADWVQKEGWLYIATALAILAIGSFMLKDDPEPDSASDPESVGASSEDDSSEGDSESVGDSSEGASEGTSSEGASDTENTDSD